MNRTSMARPFQCSQYRKAFVVCQLIGLYFLALKSAALADEQVEIFVASRCAQCLQLEDFLRSEQIHFIRHDLENDPAAESDYLSNIGRGVLPVLRVGAKTIRGFEPTRSIELITGNSQVQASYGKRNEKGLLESKAKSREASIVRNNQPSHSEQRISSKSEEGNVLTNFTIPIEACPKLPPELQNAFFKAKTCTVTDMKLLSVRGQARDYAASLSYGELKDEPHPVAVMFLFASADIKPKISKVIFSEPENYFLGIETSNLENGSQLVLVHMQGSGAAGRNGNYRILAVTHGEVVEVNSDSLEDEIAARLPNNEVPRIGSKSVSILGARSIHLEFIAQREGDPMCCPGGGRYSANVDVDNDRLIVKTVERAEKDQLVGGVVSSLVGFIAEKISILRNQNSPAPVVTPFLRVSGACVNATKTILKRDELSKSVVGLLEQMAGKVCECTTNALWKPPFNDMPEERIEEVVEIFDVISRRSTFEREILTQDATTAQKMYLSYWLLCAAKVTDARPQR